MSTRSDSAKQLGIAAETTAVAYLQAHGYRIVATNYRTRYGEVDIICTDSNTLVFVEVKASGRKHSPYMPFKVTLTKQRRLIRTAGEYLFTNPVNADAYRFDVMLMNLKGAEQWHIEHIKSAFTAG